MTFKTRLLGWAVAVLVTTVFCVPNAEAASLAENLDRLLKSHKRVLAANADVEAAREQARAQWGDWYPTLDLSGSYGHEKQVKPPGSVDTDMVPRNLDISVTQKLWDFGSANAAIRRANLTLRQSQATRAATVQTLLLEGITAHLNVIRANKLVNFARGSVANIKRQAELEDAKVQRGSGFSTDVLQAKTQLAGAESRLILAQGALRTALNRYRAVYGFNPENIAKLEEPRLPLEILPKALDEAIRDVYKSNPQLKASRLSASVAREDIRKTRADEFFPTLNAVAQQVNKVDDGGTVGSQLERIVRVELNYSLNLGLTETNTLRASEQTHIATANRFGDTRDLVEEQARNAWDNLETARSNAEQLRNQANIAAEFLELARRERQLGNRSLIDVLAGETALINASSDATSAETDVAIAIYTLLNVMGHLTPDVVN